VKRIQKRAMQVMNMDTPTKKLTISNPTKAIATDRPMVNLRKKDSR